MTDHPTDLLGAHALGALEPDEARSVAAHLASCAACRTEHARLAGIPALLDLASSAPPATAPADLEARVLGALPAPARRPRRRWRPVGVGVLAGAAAMLLLLAVTGSLGGDASEPTATTVQLTGAGAAATAVLRDGPGGTRVELTADRLMATRAGEVYELWFVSADGRVSAGTFTSDGSGDRRVTLNTAARPGGYARIGITREPDGLDPNRNGPNVLTGRLPS